MALEDEWRRVVEISATPMPLGRGVDLTVRTVDGQQPAIAMIGLRFTGDELIHLLQGGTIRANAGFEHHG